jgi:hypothetical protein
MKPVFKCDYCSKMGTEEEIREHEPKCFDNYDRRSCFTCTHKILKPKCYECDIGIEIPEGKIFEFCESYERKEESKLTNPFGEFMSGLFGW